MTVAQTQSRETVESASKSPPRVTSLQTVGAGTPLPIAPRSVPMIGNTVVPSTMDSGPSVATPLYYATDLDFVANDDREFFLAGRSFMIVVNTQVGTPRLRIFLNDNPTSILFPVTGIGARLIINNFPFNKIRIQSTGVCNVNLSTFNTNCDINT